MALGEYVSVSTQRDTEKALVAEERHELERMPKAELRELIGLLEQRGLSPTTSRTVAAELTEHDAGRSHRCGIDRALPIWAAALVFFFFFRGWPHTPLSASWSAESYSTGNDAAARALAEADLGGDALAPAGQYLYTSAHVTQLAELLEAESLEGRQVAALGRDVDPRRHCPIES